MRYDRTVIAYHGCDQRVARRLIEGGSFRASRNKYDWLGTGVYFWEFGPDRAYRFAEEQRVRGRVESPAVVGAIIQLGNCFDLMDTRFTEALAAAYGVWVDDPRRARLPLPENVGRTPDSQLRFRDCAVIDWYLGGTARKGTLFDTVRGCFPEGEPVFEGSGIRSESHIQISVRSLDCIVGVFLPASSGKERSA